MCLLRGEHERSCETFILQRARRDCCTSLWRFPVHVSDYRERILLQHGAERLPTALEKAGGGEPSIPRGAILQAATVYARDNAGRVRQLSLPEDH